MGIEQIMSVIQVVVIILSIITILISRKINKYIMDEVKEIKKRMAYRDNEKKKNK